MYGLGITPLVISPANQYGIGLYGVGPFGVHSLLHTLGPVPGMGQFGSGLGMPGMGQPGPFGMMPNLGHPGSPFGMLPNLGQTGQFGQLGQFQQLGQFGQLGMPGGFGQPQFGPFAHYGMGQGMFGMGQGMPGIGLASPMMPNIGGRQVTRIYVPSVVGIVPIDIVV